jgi:hypothetical protein
MKDRKPEKPYADTDLMGVTKINSSTSNPQAPSQGPKPEISPFEAHKDSRVSRKSVYNLYATGLPGPGFPVRNFATLKPLKLVDRGQAPSPNVRG